MRASSRLLSRRRRGLCWRQRQLRRIIQHLALLRGKLAETSSLNFPLARVGRHGAQRLDGIPDGLLTVRRQVLELRVIGAELLFLLGSQVLPGFHSPQNLLLAVWRQAVEVLQSLFKLLLAIVRKTAKLRIIFKRPPLLIERLLAMLIQPLAGMMSFCRRLIGPRRPIFSLRFGLRPCLELWPRLRHRPGRFGPCLRT